MKKLAIVLAAVVAFSFSNAASAADMPVKGFRAPITASYNWTGFYVGFEGGAGWGDTQHTNVSNGGNSGTSNINGGLFGGTYGYNMQFGTWVIGIEGDISWSGIKKDFNDNNGSFFCSGAVQCETQLRWLGTDRLRLGYAWDRLLVYGTAGVAYGSVRGTITNAGFPDGSTSRTGFIYGGGVEWAFVPKLSVKAEYLRADLGDKVTYTSVESVSLKNLNIFRVGINYNFGGL